MSNLIERLEEMAKLGMLKVMTPAGISIYDADILNEAIAALQSHKAELERGLVEATRLAQFLNDKHYAREGTQWMPLDDICGVISQIDNMCSGLVRSHQLKHLHPATDPQRLSTEYKLPREIKD